MCYTLHRLRSVESVLLHFLQKKHKTSDSVSLKMNWFSPELTGAVGFLHCHHEETVHLITSGKYSRARTETGTKKNENNTVSISPGKIIFSIRSLVHIGLYTCGKQKVALCVTYFILSFRLRRKNKC